MYILPLGILVGLLILAKFNRGWQHGASGQPHSGDLNDANAFYHEGYIEGRRNEQLLRELFPDLDDSDFDADYDRE